MTSIWVDADATPKAVREIICRAAVRTEINTCFVANHSLPLPKYPCIKMMQVEPGFDVADNHIVQQCQPGDLVITQDIPLAAELMEKSVHVINNRGETYSSETIRQRLAMRDFMESMRSSGVHTGGPSAFSDREKQEFANALDRWLAKLKQ